MIKKSLVTLSLLCALLFVSCNNFIDNAYGVNILDFSIGSAAKTITTAVKSNANINDDTELKIDCELLRGDSVIDRQSETVALKDLYKKSFELKNIPNGNNYYISLKIFYNEILIYEALSDVIILNEDSECADVSLELKQKNSSITYELNGGKISEVQNNPSSYFINSSIKLPIPEKEHYKFDGWYLSKDFATENKVSSLGKDCFLGNVVLYAKWIKFDKVSGVTITPNSQKIDFGDKILLETATEGASIHYTTDGSNPTSSSSVYNKDKSLEITDSIINENDKIVIKAIAIKDGIESSDVVTKEYTLKRYKVTLNNGDYGNVQGNITGKKKGDIIDLPKLTETDFTFDGWFDGESKVHDDTYKYIVNKDVTLTGKWINLGGVTSVSFTPSQTPDENNAVDYRETVSLSCSTSGATIWYTTDGSNPKTSDTKIKYTDSPIVIENDMTIRAYAEKPGQTASSETKQTYNVKFYTVTFNSFHGTPPSNITGKKKGEIVGKPADLTEDGWTFDGWYSNGVKVIGDITVKGNITLTAQWTEWQTVSDVIFSRTGEVDYNDEITLSCGTSGATIHYTVGAGAEKTSTTSVKLNITNNVTVKAYATKEEMNKSSETSAAYTIITYTVTFLTKHGTLPVSANKTGLKKGDPITNPGVLTENGYTFDGWYRDSGFTEPCFDFANTKVETTNVDIYAKWTAKVFSITYNNCDGDVTNSNKTTYTIEDNVNFVNPTRAGYTFDGWYTDSNLNTPVQNISKGQTGPVNVYAKWSLNPVTTPSFEVLSDGINIKWTNPAASDLSGISITCTEDTAKNKDLGKTATEYKVTCLDSSKDTYTFKIKAKTPVFESVEETVTVNLPGTVTFSIGDRLPAKGTETFDVVISGKNFNATGFNNTSFTSDPVDGVETKVTVISDTKITLGVTVPKNPGTYSVNLKYVGMSQTQTFTIREYEVGDIVYADGSISKTALTTTAIPVAVIFRAKSTGADGKTLPALGVGLKQSESKLLWAAKGTAGCGKIAEILCNSSASQAGAADIATFIGDTDGSDNWSIIYSKDPTGTAPDVISNNYTAFDWINKYGTANNLQGDYASGWYMPSIAELTELYRNKDDVIKALAEVDGTPFRTDDWYWSSSQFESFDNSVWVLNFSDAFIWYDGKFYDRYVCCIRAF